MASLQLVSVYLSMLQVGMESEVELDGEGGDGGAGVLGDKRSGGRPWW